MAVASPLSDADLHGLVDGHIDADRRADVLRRAAASPRDRALIERWQDQADMIRAAFAGVEREPLPSRLDLRTPPNLQAVPRVAKSPPTAPAVAGKTGGGNGYGWLGTAVTLAAIAAGLVGSWYVAGLPAASVPSQSETSMPVASAEPPPATVVPDLSRAGFTLTGAEVRGGAPTSLIFRYRNERDERVAIDTSRTDGDDSAPVPSQEAVVTWRSGRVFYALSGTVAPERLGAIAASLTSEARQN